MSAGEIHLHTRRSRLVLMLLLGLGMTGAGLLLLGNDDARTRFPLRWAVGGVAGTFFFGLCTVFIGMQIVRNRPALVFSPRGLQLGGLFASNWIRWDEIESMQFMTLRNQRMLCLALANEAATMREQPLLLGGIAKLNRMICGYPLAISESTLPCKLEELIEQMGAVRAGSI